MDQTLAKSNGSVEIDYHGRIVEIICQRNHGSRTFSKLQDVDTLDFSFNIILLDMSIVLILSQIMRLLLKPLKQPKVTSDILAGIILGPSILGHNENFANIAIPENSRFIIRNIGIIGFMFFLFVSGVKMDLDVITKAGKTHWVIALGGVVIPHIIVWLVAMCIQDTMDPNLRKHSSTGALISVTIITSFAVTYSILRDMHLLSSEIGRVALTIVIIIDFFGICELVMFEAIKQGEENKIIVVYYLLTLIGLSGLVINGIPRAMQWIKRQTPAGQSVDKKYITATFLGVFVIGFFSDFIGAAIATGPLWLGLAIPDGPPVGATIVNKSEVLMNDILMPFSYATIGLLTDVFAMSECWSCLAPMFALTIISYASKFISVALAARFTGMSYRDSLTLGLMLSLRGQTEFLLYLHWVDLKVIKMPSFSMMVVLTIIITSIATPIIDFLYDPTRPYMINKKRTIQHTMQGSESELRILTCIYDHESVASLFSLLDLANPTPNNPFVVFALYLAELKGRATPMIIDHTKQYDEYWDNNNETVHSAIKHYEAGHKDCLNMKFFTSVTPQQTMYQDICEFALLNKIEFIILPFHKKCIIDGTDFSTAKIRPGVQSTNAYTLSHAPCSVGILACKNVAAWGTLPTCTSQRKHRQFAMVFLGGADSREALTLAGRMAEHPYVSLIVIRFLASEYKEDEEFERRLDDGVIAWFWMNNKRNDKVVYKEIIASNGFEIVTVMHLLKDSFPIDLWIVGRQNGLNPSLVEVISKRRVNPELGLLGDFLVSKDFNTQGSILVVQQQVLRNQQVI